MPAAKYTPCDETNERREDEFGGGRRDWRRWWDKAEAFDPEKWKAMASAWWCMLQDAAKEAQAEPRPAQRDQELSLLRRRNQARGDQVQTLRHLAGPRSRGGPLRRILGSGRQVPRVRQRICPPAAHPLHRGCDGSRRLERPGPFLRGGPHLAADRLCPGNGFHGDHPRHRRLCAPGSHHPRRRCGRWPGAGITERADTALA